MPSAGRPFISVSSTGISTRKSYYPTTANGYIDVAAPGGDVYDTPDNTRDITKAVLAAYPAIGIERWLIDPVTGDPTIATCEELRRAGTLPYYQYLQARRWRPARGRRRGAGRQQVRTADWRNGGLTLLPGFVEWIMRATATNPVSGPTPYTYTPPLADVCHGDGHTHVCEGSRWGNGFYGSGILNARRR